TADQLLGLDRLPPPPGTTAVTPCLQTTGGAVSESINAGHTVDNGHRESVEVRYDCCTFVLYGDDRPAVATGVRAWVTSSLAGAAARRAHQPLRRCRTHPLATIWSARSRTLMFFRWETRRSAANACSSGQP